MQLRLLEQLAQQRLDGLPARWEVRLAVVHGSDVVDEALGALHHGLITAFVGSGPWRPSIASMQRTVSSSGNVWLTMSWTGKPVDSTRRSVATTASLSAVKAPWIRSSFHDAVEQHRRGRRRAAEPGEHQRALRAQAVDGRQDGLRAPRDVHDDVGQLARRLLVDDLDDVLVVDDDDPVGAPRLGELEAERSRARPVTTIRAAPACRAANVHARPCCPGPWMTT